MDGPEFRAGEIAMQARRLLCMRRSSGGWAGGVPRSTAPVYMAARLIIMRYG
ncbi:hypothetical protein ASZ90_009060 [hydrocarbon metagenome]|uniref:Uncharacterized protein n=1 Tax=hydrocarbon metagenome TaxID=938273 RepID=A0A0W8FJV4_9ZZZZ